MDKGKIFGNICTLNLTLSLTIKKINICMNEMEKSDETTNQLYQELYNLHDDLMEIVNKINVINEYKEKSIEYPY